MGIARLSWRRFPPPEILPTPRVYTALKAGSHHTTLFVTNSDAESEWSFDLAKMPIRWLNISPKKPLEWAFLFSSCYTRSEAQNEAMFMTMARLPIMRLQNIGNVSHGLLAAQFWALKKTQDSAGHCRCLSPDGKALSGKLGRLLYKSDLSALFFVFYLSTDFLFFHQHLLTTMRSFLHVFTALSVAIPWALGQNTTLSLNPSSVNLTTVYINDARGNRSVSYFVVKGFAIVDGDIVYGTEAALLSHAANRPDNTTIIRRNSALTSKRSNSVFPPTGWPGRVVKYQYADAAMETQFSAAVDAAIANWKAVVPCLKFEKRPIGTNVLANPPPDTPNPSDALIIKAGDHKVRACFAPLGGPGAVVLVNGCGTPELTHELVSRFRNTHVKTRC